MSGEGTDQKSHFEQSSREQGLTCVGRYTFWSLLPERINSGKQIHNQSCWRTYHTSHTHSGGPCRPLDVTWLLFAFLMICMRRSLSSCFLGRRLKFNIWTWTCLRPHAGDFPHCVCSKPTLEDRLVNPCWCHNSHFRTSDSTSADKIKTCGDQC